MHDELESLAEILTASCRAVDPESTDKALENMQAQDISKIKGRFRTELTLASADVQEVIQRRLLAKTDAEPEVLTSIYDKETDNLQTLFRFGDGSIQLKGWRGSDAFCAYYPFHPYQFHLFQLRLISKFFAQNVHVRIHVPV